MKENGPIHASDVRFLPIISAYARRLGLVEEVDRLCGPKRGVSDGQIVLALVLDALSGRSPLFRLPQAFVKLDMELLLGEAISPDKLNDDAVGRTLDRIFEVGTSKLLGSVALSVAVSMHSAPQLNQRKAFSETLVPQTIPASAASSRTVAGMWFHSVLPSVSRRWQKAR